MAKKSYRGNFFFFTIFIGTVTTTNVILLVPVPFTILGNPLKSFTKIIKKFKVLRTQGKCCNTNI